MTMTCIRIPYTFLDAFVIEHFNEAGAYLESRWAIDRNGMRREGISILNPRMSDQLLCTWSSSWIYVQHFGYEGLGLI